MNKEVKKGKKGKTKAKKKGKAHSTKKLTAKGAHVVTIVTANEATAPSPDLPLSASEQEMPRNLERARRAWNDEAEVEAEAVKVMHVVKYSEYKTEFEFRDGFCRWRDIDDTYCLSFVFKGDFRYRVKVYPANENMTEDITFVPQVGADPFYDDEGSRDVSQDEVYFDLAEFLAVDDIIFEVEVEEDQVAGLCVSAHEGPIEFQPNPNECSMSIAVGGEATRKEGCSCLYGNPCQDQYICDNWNQRFAIAKKNGWKGF